MKIILTLSYVGIHWKALDEYYQMSTHVQGFLSFLSFFIILYWQTYSHQQQKGKSAPATITMGNSYHFQSTSSHLIHKFTKSKSIKEILGHT